VVRTTFSAPISFNLGYIVTDFVSAPKSGEFDQVYMNSLYQYGYRQIVNGQAWHKMPPSLESGTKEP
jgi:hypothetical protein